MKGALFQKPFEFSLQVEGESWRQGDTITGTLRVRNHGAGELLLEGVRVALAHARLSDVRKKAPDCFEVFESTLLESGRKLAPQGEETLAWTFNLDRNSPISHKTESLFLLYGTGEETGKLGQLQISVLPHAAIEEFVKVLQVGHRFVVEGMKSRKGEVEVKLAPPDSKHFGALELFVLQCRFESEKLAVRYVFHLKKIDPASGSVVMKKETRDFDQSFGPEQYLTAAGRLNYERFEAAIGEVFSQAGLGSVL